MEKVKKNKNKKIDALFITVAVIVGIIVFRIIWVYYDSTYNCIGCRNTPCSSAFECDCGDNEKTCKCLYNDKGEVTKKIECPNNSLKTTNSNR
jgi:hypothetical protein